MDMIRMESVSKSYNGVCVLKNINLTIKKGEIVVVIGGSGCGKSTLLRLIEMLEKPDSGHIYIGDSDITAAKGKNIDRLRTRLGMVYQGFHLFSHMDVLKNITLAPVKLKHIRKLAPEMKILSAWNSVPMTKRFWLQL